MVWPPQNTGIFAYKTPCCTCPVECFFTIATDLESEAAAQAYIDDHEKLCIVDLFSDETPSAEVVSMFGNFVSIYAYYPQGSGGASSARFQIYVPDQCEITLDFNYIGSSGSVTVWDVANDTEIVDSGGGVYQLPAAGLYQISALITWDGAGPMGEGSDGMLDLDITDSTCQITYCTLQADWDDGMGGSGSVICE